MFHRGSGCLTRPVATEIASMVAYAQTGEAASGTRTVQIACTPAAGPQDIEYIESGYTDADLGPLPSSRMGHLLDALGCGDDVLGFATGAAEVA